MINFEYSISQIDLVIAKDYLKVEQDFTDDDNLIKMCVAGAISAVCSATSKTVLELDFDSSATVACMMILGEMYENRIVSIDGSKKINDMLGFLLSINRNLG